MDYNQYVLDINPEINYSDDSIKFCAVISIDMLYDESFGFGAKIKSDDGESIRTERGEFIYNDAGNTWMWLMLKEDENGHTKYESSYLCDSESGTVIPTDESPWKEFHECLIERAKACMMAKAESIGRMLEGHGLPKMDIEDDSIHEFQGEVVVEKLDESGKNELKEG